MVETKSPKKRASVKNPVDVSEKISFDVGELRLIRAIILEYSTPLKNAGPLLKILGKINRTIEEVKINEQ